MKTRIAILSIVLLAAVAGRALAQPAAATKPVDGAAKAIATALTYGSGEVLGVVHIDTRTGLVPMLDELSKVKDMDTYLNVLLDELGKLSKKVSAIDLLIDSGGKSGRVAVLYGKVTEDDLPGIQKIAGMFVGGSTSRPDAPSPPSLNKVADGEYASSDSPVTVVIGGLSKKLPDAVTLVGRQEILKQGATQPAPDAAKSDRLAKALEGVDTSAPVWGALLLGSIKERLPTVSGHLYIADKGLSEVRITFPPDVQESTLAELAKTLKRFFPGVKQTASLTVTGDHPLAKDIVAALGEARKGAGQMLSASKLKTIGMGIMMYAVDHEDNLPSDFADFIEYFVSDGEAAAKMLVNPSSGRKVTVAKVGRDWKITGECDYVYIHYDKKLSKVGDPSTTIVAYERPENYKNEQTLVLFIDGHIAAVPMDKFKELLKAAEELKPKAEK